MYCNKCGNVVPDHVSCCNVCGAVLAQIKPKVGFLEAVKLYFTRYAEFSGRSRRSEYWFASLGITLISGLLAVLVNFVLPVYMNVYAPWITLIWSLATVIPGIAICVRRLHDVGKSGWWYLWGLLPVVGAIILLVQYCSDSTPDNQWGPNPKIAAKPAVPKHQPIPAPKPQPVPQPRKQPQPIAPTRPEPRNIANPPVATPPVAAPVPPAAPPAVRAVVVLRSGPLAGKAFYCEEGKNVTVGRDPSRSDVGLPPYKSVSGVHCRITGGKEYVTVTDLGSTNGTYVNGTRLKPNQPVTVRNGSSIQLADANCVLQVRF